MIKARLKRLKFVTFGFLVLLLALFPVGSVFASGLGHGFYGTVKVDGVNAIVGTVISAQVAGTVYGSYTVTTPGQYALIVQDTIADGATIDFYIGAQPADQTFPFHDGWTTLLNLTVAAPEPDISVSPMSKNFGNVTVGSSSSPQTFTVSNVGTADLVVATISISGANANQFSKQNDNCSGQTIAPGNSATLEVVFSPTSTGAKSATLSIPSNDSDEPTVAVSLSGTGVPAPEPDISVSPTSNNFGNVTVGSSSSALTVTVSNVGTANLVVGTITISGANANQFSKQNDNSSGETIAPGGSATLQVVFSPTSTGAKSATLNVPSNDPDEATVTVSLSGNGVAAPVPDISVSPTSKNFGNVTVGSSSPAQTFTVSNVGTANLVVGTITISGANANQFSKQNDNSSGETIAPGGSATLQVVFSPTSTGAKSATLNIPSNDPDEPTVTISLSGNGVPEPVSTIQGSPASLSFWTCEGGANPPSQTLAVWNAGGGTLAWSVSDNALWLSLSPTSGSSTGEHDSVTVSVDITGMTAGSYSATITISAPGATNTPQTVPVSLHIVEFDCGELTNVELMDVDPGVDSITVSSCSLDEVDMTDMPEGVDCQYAYVVDSTGTPGSSFTLRFTDIADASSIRIYKIVDTTWTELAVTVIDATTIEITMEVGDPHILFALPTAPPPAPGGVGGTAYPPNKLAILLPWIALALAAILTGGIGWLLLRRPAKVRRRPG